MNNKKVKIRDFSKIPELCPIPNLLDIQRKSYRNLLQRFTPPAERKEQGLQEVFLSVFPIQDFAGNFILEFDQYFIGECKDSVDGCWEKGVTYSAPLEVSFNLISKKTGEIKEQVVFIGDLPLMTNTGSFIINGAERVVVNQLIRSPGIYYSEEGNENNILYKFKIIPNRGSWLEFGFDSSNMIYVRIDKKRKIPATTLLRVLGYEKNDEIMDLFDGEEIIEATLNKDNTSNQKEALIEIFRRLRPSEPPTEKNTRQLIQRLLFDPKRYDLANVGRYKINRKLKLRERILDKIASQDIVDPKNNKIIVKEEEKIDQKAISKIESVGINRVKVFNSENEVVSVYREKEESFLPLIDWETKEIDEKVAGMIINENIINPETGEVICEAGSELTSDLVYKIKEFRKEVKVKKGTSLTREDIVAALRYLVNLYRGIGQVDDIDHLGNRRVKTVGELLQDQFFIGLNRMERVIRERMTIQPDVSAITPQALINSRPLLATIRQFFGSSQLSQFMDQTNPLSEITHKRRLSALGPGGLTRERAGFEVRDVHHTHYGRICPIETPEGPNIGLIGSLSIYARINELGFIETPYFRVKKGKITDEIVYLCADDEDKYKIAPISVKIGKNNKISQNEVPCRFKGEILESSPLEIDFIDVSTRQLASISANLIPFLEHDDANRALMGTNMQRQSVPLIKNEAPLVGTGIEKKVAVDSGTVITTNQDGIVEKVDADKVIIKSKNSIEEYSLKKFIRSNQGTCVNQKPIVEQGEKVKKGDVIADGTLTSQGNLSLGRNIFVAYMPWEGYNFEDAILISNRLVREDIFTSIHISQHECEARDTKLGPEEITCDIPNIGESSLNNLDEQGIIRVGAEVESGNILVGKVTPKGETDLGPEERLLRAIFGEKAREVRDTSLRVPHGEKGKVVDVKIFSRENNDELPPGVNQLVKVFIAQMRKISEGDKISGRHGNKGVISKILPDNDMPFMADGTPVDIVLNPLGVPSRMNVGQILETHLGWVAKSLGTKVVTPIFNGAKEEEIEEALESAGLPKDGKTILYDGRTGKAFDQKVTVGYTYVLKLAHLVDDKIHARSTGPYSLVTQQPLGGKAQFGGQRFGEMEVWALEGYGAAYNLQELLTVKSDDVIGRIKTYEAIVKGEDIPIPGMPESFKVLVKELRSLSLDVKILDSQGKEVDIREDSNMKSEINDNLMREMAE
ncbi:MAG: DNA-directed RNA polymerase subunit beta [Candidatus Caldatribacteriota bacterium]|nr:DNA-directed RNA polymerase subunit beta [Candidatus Caldatribacteriota bacterium]